MTQPEAVGHRTTVTKTSSAYAGPDYFVQAMGTAWAHWPPGRWDPDTCDRCQADCGGRDSGAFVSRSCLVLCEACGPKGGGQ